jgi:hypothetical protein
MSIEVTPSEGAKSEIEISIDEIKCLMLDWKKELENLDLDVHRMVFT